MSSSCGNAPLKHHGPFSSLGRRRISREGTSCVELSPKVAMYYTYFLPDNVTGSIVRQHSNAKGKQHKSKNGMALTTPVLSKSRSEGNTPGQSKYIYRRTRPLSATRGPALYPYCSKNIGAATGNIVDVEKQVKTSLKKMSNLEPIRSSRQVVT